MMSSRLRGLLLLLWLLATSLSGQAEAIRPRLSKARYDSLLHRLQASRPDTSRVQLLVQLTQDLLFQNDDLGTDLQPAMTYARQAAALSHRLQFDAGLIGSLYVLGQVHEYLALDTLGPGLIRQGLALSQRQGRRQLEAVGWLYLGEGYTSSPSEQPAKLACFQRARALFHQLGATADEAYMLKCVADVHLVQGHPEQAIRELLEVETLYRAADHRRMHYTYDLLHASYRQMGDYKEALRYGLAAVESAHATQDTIILGGMYIRLAVAYRELKQYPQALVNYQKALANYEHNGNAVNVVTIVGHMVRIMVMQGRAREALAFLTKATAPYANASPHITQRIADYNVEVHLALRQYAVAERYVNQLVAFLQTGTADNGEKTSIYITLGKFYLQTKRYPAARHNLQSALDLNQHMGPVVRLADLHLLLFKADSAQGQFPAAIAHYQRYKQLHDSVFNETKNKQLASLEMQYDTRKKEQNIALLTKQTQAQQASLRQREFQRNALVIGALLLLLVLVLGYNRYRLKQRASRLLEVKQAEINQQNQALQHLLEEKDWMLKEIHHRVKNNLEVINSLLETQSDYLRDPAALAALRDSQNRVHAMALIHQKLYQSEKLAVVNMAAYVQETTEYLLESFDCQGAVHIVLAVAPIALEMNLATPLGLILNEALTNALKYAFPSRRLGQVSVALTETGPQQFRLLIEDNGVGFPPDFDPEDDHTMGLTIMRGLSGQIDGTLRITQTPGVRISLDFRAAAKASFSIPHELPAKA